MESLLKTTSGLTNTIRGKTHKYETMQDLINYLNNPVYYQSKYGRYINEMGEKSLPKPFSKVDVIFSLPLSELNQNIKNGRDNTMIFNSLPDSVKVALDIMLKIKLIEKKNQLTRKSMSPEEIKTERQRVIQLVRPSIDQLIEYETMLQKNEEFNKIALPFLNRQSGENNISESLRLGGKKSRRSTKKSTKKSKKSKTKKRKY